MANGYKVPNAKMTSRFGMSHSAMRQFNKQYAPLAPSHSQRLKYSTRRLQKKCKHKALVDEGYGGPGGGCVDLYCKHCGYHYHRTLY